MNPQDMKLEKLKLDDLLPTDAEVAEWYDANIDESIATVSSSIYKFRMFLKDYIQNKIEPVNHMVGGFVYTEKRKLG